MRGSYKIWIGIILIIIVSLSLIYSPQVVDFVSTYYKEIIIWQQIITTLCGLIYFMEEEGKEYFYQINNPIGLISVFTSIPLLFFLSLQLIIVLLTKP